MIEQRWLTSHRQGMMRVHIWQYQSVSHCVRYEWKIEYGKNPMDWIFSEGNQRYLTIEITSVT